MARGRKLAPAHMFVPFAVIAMLAPRSGMLTSVSRRFVTSVVQASTIVVSVPIVPFREAGCIKTAPTVELGNRSLLHTGFGVAIYTPWSACTAGWFSTAHVFVDSRDDW